MSRNPKKTKNKLKTGLNEWEFGWKRREAYANADTHISIFNFVDETGRLGSREG
jgi:hypothetical protein